MAETAFKVPPGGKPAGKGISKRVLGLPLWAWIAISATAIIIALYLRSQQPADDATGGEEYVDDYTDPMGGAYMETPLEYTPQEDVDVTDGTPTTPPSKDIDVNINVGGKKNPCGKRPITPAGIGKHWTCSNGKWVRANNNAKQNEKQKAIIGANKDKPKPGQQPKEPGCGNKPNNPAGAGLHWKCVNGKWTKAKNNAEQNAAQKKKIEQAAAKGANTVRMSGPQLSIGGNTPSPVPPRTAKAAAKKPTAVAAPKAKPKGTIGVVSSGLGPAPKKVKQAVAKPVLRNKKKK